MRLIMACAAALVGVALGDLLSLASPPLLVAAALAAVGAALAWRRPLWGTLALMVCAVSLGAARASMLGPPSSSHQLDDRVGTTVRVRGTLEAPPTLSFSGTSVHFPLRVGAARDARIEVIGDTGALGNLETGPDVELEGRLAAGDGGGPPTLLFPKLLAVDTARQSAAVDVPGRLLRWLGALRQSAQAGIAAYLPEPQASLAAGVLFGGSGRLDPAFRLELQRSGLAHLMAIDGFKQVVVASAMGAIGVHVLGARWSIVTTMVAITGYTLLTGAHASAVRAGLMVGLARLAALTGRISDPLTSVLLATLLMATLEPRVLLDLGLQLSLSATLGIVLLWPALRPKLRGVPRPIAEPLGLTLAVTLGSLPITLSAFQVVSLVSPFAHVLVVPLLPLVLVCAALLAALSPLPLLGSAAAWIAWLPTSLLALIVHVFGGLPNAAVATGRLHTVGAVALAGVLLAWGVWCLPELGPARRSWFQWKLMHRELLAPAMLSVALMGCAGLLNAMRPDGRLHVEPLRLARGQAVFIRGPTGRTAVVALGRLDAIELVGEVADHLAVWEHGLDVAVALDASSERGLAVTLARYPAGWSPPAAPDVRLDIGGGAGIEASSVEGQLIVNVISVESDLRSGLTTSAARPGSAG